MLFTNTVKMCIWIPFHVYVYWRQDMVYMYIVISCSRAAVFTLLPDLLGENNGFL